MPHRETREIQRVKRQWHFPPCRTAGQWQAGSLAAWLAGLFVSGRNQIHFLVAKTSWAGLRVPEVMHPGRYIRDARVSDSQEVAGDKSSSHQLSHFEMISPVLDTYP
jgi:hypothetical protein